MVIENYNLSWKSLICFKNCSLNQYITCTIVLLSIKNPVKYFTHFCIKMKTMWFFQCEWLEYASQWVSKARESLLNTLGGKECSSQKTTWRLRKQTETTQHCCETATTCWCSCRMCLFEKFCCDLSYV